MNELSRKTFDLQRLKDNKIRQKFNTEVKNRYEVLREIDDNNENMGDNITEIWDNIKDIYTKTAEKVLGLKNRKRKQWLSDKTWENIKERKAIKIKLNAAKSNRLKTKLQSNYRDKDKEVKKSAKNDSRNYIEELANEAEEASKRGELSVVYKITRQLCGKSRNNDAPVLSKEGKILTTDKEKLGRWAEHFKNILNSAETNDDIPDIQPSGDALEIDTEAGNKHKFKDGNVPYNKKRKAVKQNKSDSYTSKYIRLTKEKHTLVVNDPYANPQEKSKRACRAARLLRPMTEEVLLTKPIRKNAKKDKR
ncbi:unnamed protein product [Mytilus coruscus]|uniref:Uncharacterized protein n=1 Tax=Mytilus coruscus TaxID=42192 RepID=A0A6J8DD36_MYTCO|nr:unnamed protein product [Mytilus coruscus]